MFHIQAIHKKFMANCVKCRFSLNLQSFSVVLKSNPVRYLATSCPCDSHQIHRSCTSMSLLWQNNKSLWLSWTVSIPKWVSILQHTACAPSDAKLLEGGVKCVSLAPNDPEYMPKHPKDGYFKPCMTCISVEQHPLWSWLCCSNQQYW